MLHNPGLLFQLLYILLVCSLSKFSELSYVPSTSDICRLTLSRNIPKSSIQFYWTVRLLGTQVLEPCTWCMYLSNPTRTKSLLLFIIGGISYITKSKTPKTFCVYYCTFIALPFRPTYAPSRFLLPFKSFFKIQQFSHSGLKIALPI